MIKVDKKDTVRFHVDNVMSNHVKPKVNDKFKEWMNCNYNKHGEVKANKRKVNEYLGISLDLTEKVNGKIKRTAMLK